MQTYDILMLVVLAATTIFGAIKGFAWQLASVASIVASYFIAYAFRNDVAKMINAEPPWNVFLAMLLLYFGSSFVIWMVFRLVSSSIDKVRLREFDRHLGAGFGLLKGMLLCLLITMFAMSLLGVSQQQRIANSKSGLYISRILASAGGILPAEIKEVVGPYLDDVEQRLQNNQQSGLQRQFSESSSDVEATVKDVLGRVQEKVGQAAGQIGRVTEQFGQVKEQFGQMTQQAEQASSWLKENVPAQSVPAGQPTQYQPPATSYQPTPATTPHILPNAGSQGAGFGGYQGGGQSGTGGYGPPVFVPIQPQQGGVTY